jgi:hypothetical protein
VAAAENFAHTTAFAAVHQCTEAVMTSMASYFPGFPSTDEEREDNSAFFFRAFGVPGCLGAVDCTHIVVKKPTVDNAWHFRDRHEDYSLSVQAVVDADLVFRNVRVGDRAAVVAAADSVCADHFQRRVLS